MLRLHRRLVSGLGLVGLGLMGCGTEPAPMGPEPEVVIGLHATPVSFDPHRQSEASSLLVLSSVYEALVHFDSELRVAPLLAVSWSSPDPLTWRLELRSGVTFHDGRPLEAEDVVFSLERAKTVEGTRVAGLLGGVAKVEAQDSRTVVVTTEGPNPILLNKLAFVLIVPRGAPATIESPIGTGPYRWVGANPEDGVHLEAFTRYWGSPASEPRVRLQGVPDREDRVRRLMSGELALITRVEPSDLDRLIQSERATAVSRPGLLTVVLQLRVDRPPFDDPRVREAVNLGLDRKQLVDEFLHGHGVPVGQPVSPLVFGYAPDVGAPQRDLERARALLREAGYSEGVELVLEHREGRHYELVVQQLQEVGFRARAQPSPWPELYPRILAGEVPFCVFGWIAAPGDASDVLDALVHTPDPDRGYGEANWSGFSSPELDALIERSRLEEEAPKRVRLLQAAMRGAAAENFLIPLYVPNDLYGLRRDVMWQPRLDARLFLGDLRLGRP